MRPASALFPLAILTAVVIGIAQFVLSRPAPPSNERKVKLAVLVVFDQMRGDYLTRWREHFCASGFARLQRDGAWFSNCHYPYATTTTGPGHASMLTGTSAEVHGIVNNNWFQGDKPVEVVSASEPKYRFVPDLQTKADGFGKPDHLLSETVADVLKRETRGKAKVFGLSLKDRSAILPTGKHPDGAFWFHGGNFGTSTYYTNGTRELPVWVERFNASRVADRWFGTDWTRLRSKALYDASVGDDVQPGEGNGVHQGVKFPHPTTGAKGWKPGDRITPGYYTALANTPFGNDLLLEFAKACLVAEQLGRHDTPDLLVVSFSSNDLIGHTWGPDSHEVMDVTLRSDLLMADLLAFLDAHVGRGRYVLGMTADHGVCPLPEVTQAKWRREGRADWAEARRVDMVAMHKTLDAHLAGLFPVAKEDGKPTTWVNAILIPWVFLNEVTLQTSRVPRERVVAEVVKFVAAQPGVARTMTRAELAGPISPSDEIAVKMKRSYYPARSGDVGIVLKPYCIPVVSTQSKDGWEPQTGTTHGAPYDYDTHVPLVVFGPGIRGRERTESTTPQALARIFAQVLDIPAPKDASFPIPTTLFE